MTRESQEREVDLVRKGEVTRFLLLLLRLDMLLQLTIHVLKFLLILMNKLLFYQKLRSRQFDGAGQGKVGGRVSSPSEKRSTHRREGIEYFFLFVTFADEAAILPGRAPLLALLARLARLPLSHHVLHDHHETMV